MRIGCLLSLVLGIAPRLVLFFIWLFTSRVSLAFDGFLLPLIGFIFLPFFTLAYVMVWDHVGGVSGWGWLLVIGGLFFDVAAYAISMYANRTQFSDNGRKDGANSA